VNVAEKTSLALLLCSFLQINRVQLLGMRNGPLVPCLPLPCFVAPGQKDRLPPGVKDEQKADHRLPRPQLLQIRDLRAGERVHQGPTQRRPVLREHVDSSLHPIASPTTSSSASRCRRSSPPTGISPSRGSWTTLVMRRRCGRSCWRRRMKRPVLTRKPWCHAAFWRAALATAFCEGAGSPCGETGVVSALG